MKPLIGNAFLSLAVLATGLGLASIGLQSSAIAQVAAPLGAPQSVPQKSQISPPPPASRPTPPAAPAKDGPMQVRLVRLAEPGCEPDCPEWISAIGRIDATSPGEFRKVLTKLGDRKLPVLVDSGGGSVDAGYAIGRMVRAKNLDVVVTKTEFTSCTLAASECTRLRTRGYVLGRPVAKISKCASSCAFVLAGGVRRFVGPWTFVGLHELKSISYLVQRQYLIERRLQYGVPVEVRRTLIKEKTMETKEGPTGEKVYDKVRSYFVEMGVSEAVMPLLRSAPHTSIRLLQVAELKAVGLATDFVNGEQLLLSKTSATSPPTLPAIVATVPPTAKPPAPHLAQAPASAAAEPAAPPPAAVVTEIAPAPPAALAGTPTALFAVPAAPSAAAMPGTSAPADPPAAKTAAVAKPKPKAQKSRQSQAERVDPFRSN